MSARPPNETERVRSIWEADHIVREPLEPLKQHGFKLVELERLKWGIVERVAARKPGGAQE